MNYYLARDGQTYGPYPQETFPAMLQQGQVVPQDLVCPEGASDWVELSTVPALSGAMPAPAAPFSMPGMAAPVVASSSKSPGSGPMMPTPTASSANPVSMPTPVASSSLRRSGVSSKPHATSPPVMAAPTQPHPQAAHPQQKTGLMQKGAGAWGVLRIVGYAAVAIFIVVSLVGGYFVSQREKKEIAKLQSQPGWKAFEAGNSQINEETSTTGYGNTGEAQRLASTLAGATEAMEKLSFEFEKTPRYRGRSKLGRVVAAVDSVDAGKGHFQTYIELRDDRAIVLVHVPEFSRYKRDARQSMAELCWETANLIVGGSVKPDESKPLAAELPAAATPTGRPRSRKPPPTKPPPVELPPATVETKPVKERTLVVGVRGKSDYECVFVGKISAIEDAPAPMPIKKNVPSHQALVKWFGEEKPAE